MYEHWDAEFARFSPKRIERGIVDSESVSSLVFSPNTEVLRDLKSLGTHGYGGMQVFGKFSDCLWVSELIIIESNENEEPVLGTSLDSFSNEP